MKSKLWASCMLAVACAAPLSAMPAESRETQAQCHPLLMPTECRTFHERIEGAETGQARRAVELEYRRLIAEREKACPGLEASPKASMQLPGRLPLPLRADPAGWAS